MKHADSPDFHMEIVHLGRSTTGLRFLKERIPCEPDPSAGCGWDMHWTNTVPSCAGRDSQESCQALPFVVQTTAQQQELCHQGCDLCDS